MTTAKPATNGVKVTPGKPAAGPVKKIFPPMPPVEDDHTDDDFLNFWGEWRAQQKPKTTTILGVEVEIPTDVPLMFDEIQERLSESRAESDSEEAQALFGEMCTVLFGENTYEQWRAKRLTVLQLRVLVTWGMLNAQGQPSTFAEAGEVVNKAIKDEAEGKLSGPNRATRRKNARDTASSKTGASATTGRRSKQISPASTASKRAN